MVVLILTMIIEGLALSSPYLFGTVVNGLQSRLPFEKLLYWALAIFGTAIIAEFVTSLKEVYELRCVDFSVPTHLSDKTLSKILGLSIGQHRSQNSGITQSVINQGQASLIEMTFLGLFQVLPMVMKIMVTLIALTWFNTFAGVFVLCALCLHFFFSSLLNKKYWKRIKGFMSLSHKNSKSHQEILRNVSVVQINSQEKRVQGEHKIRLDNHANEGRSIWIPYLFWGHGRNLITSFTRFAVISFGIYLVLKKGYRFGDFVVLTTWTNLATADLAFMSRLQRQFLNLFASIEKYFAILDVKPAVEMAVNPIRPMFYSGCIEFRNVSFTYPDMKYIELDTVEEDRSSEEVSEVKENEAATPALVDVSFKIEAGQCVAFVGESGAGKSTIVSLLMRGYDPDHGQVMVDDHDIRLVDLGQFRESLGVVDQSIALFDGTLRYNILFGLNGRAKDVTDAEIEEISIASCIDRFSHRLTKGWDTLIGENGVKLSGGERQRVGIARALVKKPSILILDEATSNLDAVNEELIGKAIHNASLGRTTIMIAHRLSTVRKADKIFVMNKGRIVAEGTHEVLNETCDIYNELFARQLSAAQASV